MDQESTLQINCDLGECLTPNPDATVMPLIDIANIACGGHAGDDRSMSEAIQLAKQNGVKIGSHPGYRDPIRFGRVPHSLNEKDLFTLINNQVLYFQKLCLYNNAKPEYLKPHGALYHQMVADSSVLRVICRVIRAIDPNLLLIVPAGINRTKLQTIAENEQIRLIYEVFADRAYVGFQMIDRGKKDAVLDNPKDIVEQYRRFINEPLLQIDTICFHSDNPASVQALQLLRA